MRKNILGQGFASPYGTSLYIDSLAVGTNYQKQGIGNQLFRSLLKTTIKDGVNDEVFLYVDKNKLFPKDWYQRIGLKETSLLPLSGKVKDLTL